MDANAKYNHRNPAVKRIMQEMKEMMANKSSDFIAEALENDIFEWHFVIKGPVDSDFEGGVYHGRILLPPDYPFKPPAFMMLSPSGRFETNMKICLSISSHHPEHWQPSWSVRTALTALIAFMPSPGAGALGSLDFPAEERKRMAVRARAEPPKFGSEARQRVVDEMHARMLAIMEADKAGKAGEDVIIAGAGGAAADVQPDSSPALAPQQAQAESASSVLQPLSQPGKQAQGLDQATLKPSEGQQGLTVPLVHAASASQVQGAGNAAPAWSTAQQHVNAPAAAGQAGALCMTAAVSGNAGRVAGAGRTTMAAGRAAAAAAATPADHMLTAVMWALYVGIAAILLRKALGAFGVDLNELLAVP